MRTGGRFNTAPISPADSASTTRPAVAAPLITVVGLAYAGFLEGAVLTETVFAWPGLGRLAYEGISSRDFPVIQAVVLTTAALVAVVNLSVDCLYALIDPRIRYVR